ncbi:hypothetical protein Bca4012_068032 [Brassica carinata]|uniref:B box-type domain-containing protein n=1 Tax=Brassica carinata TaxID=52824 RepID=A0A8X7VUJ1_BRACI|nr:hypothetical protein Bca52824_020265 [Brassica carinata]
MAKICQRCTSTTSVIHCVTETQNFCLTCDYLRHCEVDAAGHIRYQICDECMNNPALLLCSDHMIALCQSCYSRHYNCVASGHHIQIINRFPQQHHNNNNSCNGNDLGSVNDHEHGNGNGNDHEHKNHVGDNQRGKGLFQMSCNGNNSCEILSAMDCESCLKSDAVTYCPLHNKLLCYYCDIKIHLPEPVPPHMRCLLCVTCKRLSPTFLVGMFRFVSPPTLPVAAANETYTPAPHPASSE